MKFPEKPMGKTNVEKCNRSPIFLSAVLSDYAGIGLPIRPLQQCSFQDITEQEIKNLEDTLIRMVSLIAQGNVIRNGRK
jgi:hypothetical protein